MITTKPNDQAQSAIKESFYEEFGGSLYNLPNSESTITQVKNNSNNLEIIFSDGTTNKYPLIWLRDNCQCVNCFDPRALGRSFLWNDFNLNIQVSSASLSDNGQLQIIWDDGHKSNFSSKWLQERAFNDVARKRYRNMYSLPKAFYCKWINYFVFPEKKYPIDVAN